MISNSLFGNATSVSIWGLLNIFMAKRNTSVDLIGQNAISTNTLYNIHTQTLVLIFVETKKSKLQRHLLQKKIRRNNRM